MDCHICELHQRRFYCVNCLRNRLLEHKNNLSKISKERQVAKDQAELLAKSTEGPRVQRADITRLTAHLKELRQDTERLRKSNDSTRTRVAALRTQLATRRSNLLTARSISSLSLNDKSTRSTVQFPESSSSWDASLDDVNYQLTQTRKSLVDELLEAFDLAETDVSLGRSRRQNVQAPTVGVSAWNASAFTRHASKLSTELFLRPPLMAPKRIVTQTVMKWTISGLSVPLPAELNRLVENGITAPSVEETNASICSTLQFLNLLCFYLGIKLPFGVFWSKGKTGLGIPYLKASSGPEHGNWAKWVVPCALYVSPTLITNPSSNHATESYSIAYSMLAYNICYVAYTQSIFVPLPQTGNLLANLWTICSEGKSIGQFSHQTSSSSLEVNKQPAIWPAVTSSGVGTSHPLHHGRMLEAPTPPLSEFPLDFEVLLEFLAGRKLQPPVEPPSGGVMVEDEHGEGWSVVDFEEEA
ncbi:hypothetical protein CPB86DRAFT_765623 [Serendipita vermifera]|nr:hypothetical protein CPB86DRAFT_765623 [Serendipita vermifera]